MNKEEDRLNSKFVTDWGILLDESTCGYCIHVDQT
jgi:hypothetical protein